MFIFSLKNRINKACRGMVCVGGGIPPNFYNYRNSLGDTIVCDELVKAIEGVTTNGKTKLQQG